MPSTHATIARADIHPGIRMNTDDELIEVFNTLKTRQQVNPNATTQRHLNMAAAELTARGYTVRI